MDYINTTQRGLLNDNNFIKNSTHCGKFEMCTKMLFFCIFVLIYFFMLLTKTGRVWSQTIVLDEIYKMIYISLKMDHIVGKLKCESNDIGTQSSLLVDLVHISISVKCAPFSIKCVPNYRPQKCVSFKTKHEHFILNVWKNSLKIKICYSTHFIFLS